MTTTSITFRIDDNQIERLRKLADEQRISLNTLITHILDSYLEFEFIAPKVGFAPMQKSVLKDLFEAVPDEEKIKQIAIKAADDLIDSILIIYGKVDLDSVLSLISSRVRRSGFTLREFENGKSQEMTRVTRKLVMQHDVGYHWSLFSKTHIERLINNAGYAAKIEMTENSLIIEILERGEETGADSRGQLRTQF
ncbi:hypothetical protein NVIE_019170 [Nitrososphaera viennensis EN76]|uniref:Uncharacterized protein n=1 Tax=Nitrososphaera viennensis EN76 TaxID=926571 RepID=A0A060HLS8_9ARCH|nr:hypothetical protein NVIE_019170 [Nitrososphaera viennensis EN76]